MWKRNKKKHIAMIFLAAVMILLQCILPVLAASENFPAENSKSSALLDEDESIQQSSQPKNKQEETSLPEITRQPIDPHIEEEQPVSSGIEPAESADSSTVTDTDIISDAPEPSKVDQSVAESSASEEISGKPEMYYGFVPEKNEPPNSFRTFAASASVYTLKLVSDNVQFLEQTFSDGYNEDRWYPKRLYETGEVAYCVEHGVSIPSEYQGGYTPEELSVDMYQRISLADFYGRTSRSGDALKNEYMVQLYIWELQGVKIQALYYKNHPEWAPWVSMSDYTAFKAEIQPKVDAFFKKPSFNLTKIKMKPGETVTLKDTNGVVSLYEDTPAYNDTGLIIKKSGNTLTLTATTSSQSGVFRFRYILPPGFYRGTPLYYENASSQDVMVCGRGDPAALRVDVEIENLGDLKLVKTSDDGIVSGIKFRVVGGGWDWTATTNAAGEIFSPGWTAYDDKGKPYQYVVTELNVPGRYNTPASQTITFEPGKTTTVKFKNTLKKGNVKLVKTSEDGIIAGLKFEITGGSNTYTKTTDANGEISVKDMLVYDKNNKLITYTAKETNVPGRYNPPASQNFTLKNGATTTINFANNFKRADLQMIKTSEDGIIGGLHFEITGNGQMLKKTSDSKGKIDVTGLQVYDSKNKSIEYTVKEVDIPARYVPPQTQKITLEYGKVASVSFLNVLQRADLKIIKQSEDALIEGLEFRITGGGVDIVMQTDKNGEILIPDLRVYNEQNEKIVYTVEEVNTPARYGQPENQEITLTYGETTTVTFVNVLQRAELKILKQSEDGLIEGLEFRITGGEVDIVMQTDENGKITVPDLRVYDEQNEKIVYTVEEVNTPARYVKPEPQTIILLTGLEKPEESEEPENSGESEESRPEESKPEESNPGESNPVISGLGTSPLPSQSIELMQKIRFPQWNLSPLALHGGGRMGGLETESEASGLPVSSVPEESGLQDSDLDEQPDSERDELNLAEFFNSMIRGTVEVIKTDSENPDSKLSGALFTVFADMDADGAYTEDIDEPIGILLEDDTEPGLYMLPGLTYGHYLLTEAIPPEGFLPDSNFYPFEIMEDGQTVRLESVPGKGFPNDPMKGTVRTTKVNAEDSTDKLPGGVFDVYADINQDGKYTKDIDMPAGTLEEVEYGVYELSDLRYGDYLFHERIAPKGFLADPNYYPFKIAEDGQLVEFDSIPGKDFPNHPKKGAVQTTKVNAEDPSDKLTGGVFDLYRDTNKDGKYTKGIDKPAGTLVEVKYGIYELHDIPAGDYLFHERTAPKGFAADPNYYPFEIVEDGQLVKFESIPGQDFPNHPSSLPQTGDSSNIVLPLILAGSSCTILIFSLTFKHSIKKKRRKAENEIKNE